MYGGCVLWKLAVAIAVLADPYITGTSAQDNSALGQGEWTLSYKTEQTNGNGCDTLFLDEEFRTGLVINAKDAASCKPGSLDCKYVFHWKCASFNEQAQIPETQEAAVTLRDAASASVDVAPTSYKAFGGTWTVVQETYTITDQSMRGNESWTWVSDDGKSTCSGEDHIAGLLGSYDCSGEHDIIDDAVDPDAPVAPAPEGRWRLKATTTSAIGDGCADMEIKEGFQVNSAVVITRLDPADADPDAAGAAAGLPQFTVFWKCSTDESLVEWEDTGVARAVEGGNITLTVNRTQGASKKAPAPAPADGGDAEIPDDSYEETRSVMRLTFCPVRGAGGAVDYKICHGRELWTWRYGDGRECTGWDRIRGIRGECTDAMETALEVTDADDELEDWLNAMYDSDEAGDLEAFPDLPPDAFNSPDAGPTTQEGYRILDYKAPRSAALGALLVGVPVGTLALGLAVTYLRRRCCPGRGRPDPAAGYSLVAVGGADGDAPRV